MCASPARRLEYRSFLFDSRNWDGWRPRAGDVVISTSYKSGTTWMQNILRQIVFPEPPRPPVAAVSPWIDRRHDDISAVWAGLEAQRHRRFLKSHLPLDAIPFHPEVSYVVVVRDARDVFMSFWNHYSGMTDAYFDHLEAGGFEGPAMPRPPADLHTLWPRWISEGWFPWETEGWPHSGNLRHTATWWRFRHLPNILFVHFADLIADLPGEIARVAAFLGAPLAPDQLAAAAQAVGFEAIRADPAAAGPMPPEAAASIWKDGLGTFFHRGTNGRWRGVLTPDELALYASAKARCLPPDAAAYLESGRAAWPAPPPEMLQT